MDRLILIVDDDAHIREVISFAVERAGMKTLHAINGKEALEKARNHAVDFIVLDVSMPEMDGLEVCRELRKTNDLPILFLSSRDEEIDRIIGLEIGGDDYMTKPFSPRELVARIKAILKRNRPSTTKEPLEKVKRGNITIEIPSYTAFAGEKTAALTATEFRILLTLFQHPEKVFTRDQFMNYVYEPNVFVSDRTIDSHIRRIRRKFLELGINDVITTSHGIGYKLGTCL